MDFYHARQKARFTRAKAHQYLSSRLPRGLKASLPRMNPGASTWRSADFPQPQAENNTNSTALPQAEDNTNSTALPQAENNTNSTAPPQAEDNTNCAPATTGRGQHRLRACYRRPLRSFSACSR
jgi:hypothetical protein